MGRVARAAIWTGGTLVVLSILTAPILAYIDTFGIVRNDRENAWAAMGAAMSGMYGPILSIFTLAVLIIQVQLQRQTTQLQQQSAELQRQDTQHIRDESYIQVSRSDIEFYLSKLVDIFSPAAQGEMLRQTLHGMFAKASVEQLKSDEVQEEANLIDKEFPQLQAAWAALNTILKGLEAEDQIPFQLQLVSAQQKAIVMLSYPTCASLDNYIYCLTEGKIAYPFLFSTSFTQDRRNADQDISDV